MYTPFTEGVFEEKQAQNDQKTQILTGKDRSTKVCTCRTLASEVPPIQISCK